MRTRTQTDSEQELSESDNEQHKTDTTEQSDAIVPPNTEHRGCNRTTKRHHSTSDLLGNVTNQYDFVTTVKVCLKQVTHPNSTRSDEY